MNEQLTVVDSAIGKLQAVYHPEEFFKFQQELQALTKRNLVEGSDYGLIPGAKTPVLLKPGAEKICMAFGLKPDYEITDSTIDHFADVTWTKMLWNDKSRRKEPTNGSSVGLYRYAVKCILRNGRGEFMGSGAGLCSTLETKYCDRPRDLENTILKMAQKRSLVAAVLNALGLSGMFTQDLDETEFAAQPAEAAHDSRPKSNQSAPKPRPPFQPQQPAEATAEVVAKPEIVFDPSDKRQADWLVEKLDKMGVSDLEIQDAVAVRLRGTPRSKLLGRIDELVTEVSKSKDRGANDGSDGEVTASLGN